LTTTDDQFFVPTPNRKRCALVSGTYCLSVRIATDGDRFAKAEFTDYYGGANGAAVPGVASMTKVALDLYVDAGEDSVEGGGKA